MICAGAFNLPFLRDYFAFLRAFGRFGEIWFLRCLSVLKWRGEIVFGIGAGNLYAKMAYELIVGSEIAHEIMVRKLLRNYGSEIA